MKYLQFIGRVLTVASICFVVWAISQMDYSFWNKLPKGPVTAVILGCSFLYAIFFGLLSIGWYLLLRAISTEAKEIPFPILHWIYTKSNLMKYLPGNVLEFVGRNIFTSKYGVSHTQIALASFIETVLIVLVSAALGVVCGFDILKDLLDKYDLSKFFNNISYLVVCGAVCLVALAVYMVLRKVKALGITPDRVAALFKATVKVFFLQCFVFANLSLTFFLIYSYGFSMDLGLQDFLFILSGFTLSWVIGFVTPGAPGGIGVKEIGLVSLLASRYGMEATLLASVLHRIISVAGDVLAYLMSLLILRRNA